MASCPTLAPTTDLRMMFLSDFFARFAHYVYHCAMRCNVELSDDLDIRMEHIKLALHRKGIITTKSKAEAVTWLLNKLVIEGMSYDDIKTMLDL